MNGAPSWFPVTIVSVLLTSVIDHDSAGALAGTIQFVLPVRCAVVNLGVTYMERNSRP